MGNTSKGQAPSNGLDFTTLVPQPGTGSTAAGNGRLLKCPVDLADRSGRQPLIFVHEDGRAFFVRTGSMASSPVRIGVQNAGQSPDGIAAVCDIVSNVYDANYLQAPVGRAVAWNYTDLVAGRGTGQYAPNLALLHFSGSGAVQPTAMLVAIDRYIVAAQGDAQRLGELQAFLLNAFPGDFEQQGTGIVGKTATGQAALTHIATAASRTAGQPAQTAATATAPAATGVDESYSS